MDFMFCLSFLCSIYPHRLCLCDCMFCFSFCLPKPLYTVFMICVISDLVVVTDIFSCYVNFFGMWQCCFATTSSVNYSLVSQVPAAALYRFSPKIFYFCFKMKNYSQYPNIKMIISNTQVMIVMFLQDLMLSKFLFKSKMANKIKILSLNCNGVNNKLKRTSVLSWLASNRKGLTFLQETHSSEAVESDWNKYKSDYNI